MCAGACWRRFLHRLVFQLIEQAKLSAEVESKLRSKRLENRELQGQLQSKGLENDQLREELHTMKLKNQRLQDSRALDAKKIQRLQKALHQMFEDLSKAIAMQIEMHCRSEYDQRTVLQVNCFCMLIREG